MRGRVSNHVFIVGILSLLLMAAIWLSGGFGRFFPFGKVEKLTHPVTTKISQNQQSQWQEMLHQDHFKQQFRLKRATDILGLGILHLESRRIPQQVIIAEHVPPSSSEVFFQEKPDVGLISLIANQLLILRHSKHPLRLTINTLDVGLTEPLLFNHKLFKQREVTTEIQLSTEKKPRQYKALIVAYPQSLFTQQPSGNQDQTVLVTFAKPDAFNARLLLDLLENNPQFKLSETLPDSKHIHDNPIQEKKGATR